VVKKASKKPRKMPKVGKSAKRIAGKGFGGVKGLLKSILLLPRSIYRFLKSVRHELKLVSWLSKKQTTRWSTAVIATAIILGGILALSDYIYFLLRDLLFKKL
jgi:preprotein translocase SecE subunit